jgi:hypothetical protein
MGKIIWTIPVRNEVLHRIKEERNILNAIRRSKAKWICHISLRNCFVKHAIEGKRGGMIELTGRGGRRRKQLLDEVKETRGYWKWKKEALHRTQWGTRFCPDYGIEILR